MIPEETLLKEIREKNKKFLNTIPIEEFLKLDAETLTDEEYKARASDAELFYKNYFGKVLKLLILKEMEYLAKEAENNSMLIYCRGHIAAYEKIQKWFDEQVSISLSRFQKEESALED